MSATEHFDQAAAHWDEAPRRLDLARAVAETIARRIPLSRALDVLDYGCGTGLLGLALRARVGSLTGADTSPGMLEVLGQKVREQGLANVRTLRLDPADPLAGAGDFHLIVSSMTLHHVPDLAPLARCLHAHLRPGGWVALADLEREDGSFHDDSEGVFHPGFEREELQALLADAGFTDIRIETAARMPKHGREYPVLLATGRKAG